MYSLMTYDPWRTMAAMERSFNSAMKTQSFRADISDLGDGYKIEAELPGFSKEDISIDLKDELLTISVERKQESDEEKPNYIRRERFYGSYRRSYDVSSVDADAISAEYKDGILTVNLPKKPELAPRKLEIQ